MELPTPFPPTTMRPTARIWRERSLWKVALTETAWVIDDLFDEIDQSGADIQVEMYEAHNDQRTLVLSFPASDDGA